MAIRKVVFKEKTIKNKPYFNDDNIYIWQRGYNDFLKLTKCNDKFKWSWLSNSVITLEEYNSFEEVVDNIRLGDLYIFNNIKQLILLLNRNYSHIDYCKHLKETSNIADDEVHIDDCSNGNLYATLESGTNNIRILNGGFEIGIYKLINLKSSYSGLNYDFTHSSTLKDVLECCKTMEFITDIYEFSGDNKQEEFFEWTLNIVRINK